MSYEAIFWLGLAIVITAWAGAAAIGVVFAWRLHRRTAEKLQEARKSAGGAGRPWRCQ